MVGILNNSNLRPSLPYTVFHYTYFCLEQQRGSREFNRAQRGFKGHSRALKWGCVDSRGLKGAQIVIMVAQEGSRGPPGAQGAQEGSKGAQEGLKGAQWGSKKRL